MGVHKTSAFVKFHVNQGIVLAIGWVGWSILGAILSAVIKVNRTYSIWGIPGNYRATPGWLTTIIWLVNVGFCVVAILGIANAATGKTKPLPVIGNFTILK